MAQQAQWRHSAARTDGWHVPYEAVALHLFWPVLRNQTLFLHICGRENLLAHAKHAVSNNHLMLTVHKQDHLHAYNGQAHRPISSAHTPPGVVVGGQRSNSLHHS
jgi:hypothetical protein